MQYALLIYTNENLAATAPQAEQEAVMAAYYEFDTTVKQVGIFHNGEALQDSKTATTVRVREGKILVTDGPYVETKEQLGGYYILECQDQAEAIAWAAKIPGARYAPVEVRPIMQLG